MTNQKITQETLISEFYIEGLTCVEGEERNLQGKDYEFERGRRNSLITQKTSEAFKVLAVNGIQLTDAQITELFICPKEVERFVENPITGIKSKITTSINRGIIETSFSLGFTNPDMSNCQKGVVINHTGAVAFKRHNSTNAILEAYCVFF